MSRSLMRTMTLVPRRCFVSPMWCSRAVVADGDDSGGVDFVVAHAEVRRDFVASGEGFGPVVERLAQGVPVQGSVGSGGVVVVGEFVELAL